MTTLTVTNVSGFRNLISHLERVINVDFAACVGDDEKSYCKSTVARLGEELLNTTCKRSKADDEERKTAVLARASNLILTGRRW